MKFFTWVAILPLATAITPPNIQSSKLIWSDSFKGNAGSPVSSSTWGVATSSNTNSEVETYTTSSKNIQLSGGQTLQLVPWRDSHGKWTSGRIETKESWTPQAGKITTFQGSIALGTNVDKQGIWPAFWMLGDSMRHGTGWPTCGELDIMEQINGVMTGYGTAHCDSCNEPVGRSGKVSIPDDQFHTWTMEIDRRSSAWQSQEIRWSRDGQVFNTIKGSEFGDEGSWAILAHSPYYMILNVAVGGNFPGAPSAATDDGYGSMMEVAYVAIYESQ